MIDAFGALSLWGILVLHFVVASFNILNVLDQPIVITVATAADVLKEYKRGVLKLMGRPARTRDGGGYDQVTFSERQVRYAMAGIGRPLHLPAHSGDPLLMDSVECAMLAMFIVASERYGIGQRAAWAALLYMGDRLREGLRHPKRGLVAEIYRSRVTVRPGGGPMTDDAVTVPLGLLRADVEELIDESLRRSPVKPVTVARAGGLLAEAIA